MTVTLSIDYACWQYRPQQDDGAKRSGAQILREMAAACRRAAGIVAALERDGWSVQVYGDYTYADHPAVRTVAQARRRVTALGISLSDIRMDAMPSPAALRRPYRRTRQRPAG